MTTTTDKELNLDSLMPDYDVALAEHVVVSADPATTWRAARELDLLTVHSMLLDAAMWIRGLPARLVGRAVPVPRLVIADGGLPGWLVRGESGHEIVFGAVGRFWLPAVRQVAKLAARIGARGHISFGGRLTPDARGFPASAMARTKAGTGETRMPCGHGLRRW